MADTIQVKVTLKKDIDMEEMDFFKGHIVSLRSPNGFKYCDILEESRNKTRGLNIKISYPRYFNGNNAYLITKKHECFEVQEHFIDSIVNDTLFKQIVRSIELARVDIPFTYYMKEDMDFHSYVNIYRIFAKVYNSKKGNARPKSIIDIIKGTYETVVYSDNGKSDKSSNNKLMIYNQYLNLRNKLEERNMVEVEKKYPDLKRRIRLEVSKRIRRKEFTLEKFKSFDILGEYFEEYKSYILENVLNEKEIEAFYNKKVEELVNKLIKERAYGNFKYEVFILKDFQSVYDYEILRRALKINIDNKKTRENAITRVRKILTDYEYENKIIIMDTYKIICEMREYIKNLKIED